VIGLALHLGAVAVDEAREAARGLSWAASFAVASAQLALAARLDPEAARAVGEVGRLRADLEELRAAGAGLVAARDRLYAAEDAAHEAGQPLPLAPWIEAQEAWDRLVRVLRLGVPRG